MDDSYRLFIPYFTLDFSYLKSVRDGMNQEYLPIHDVLLSDFPTSFDCSINQRGGPDFFVECELQVKKLFSFLERHLAKIEGDLTAVLSTNAEVTAIRSNTEQYDIIWPPLGILRSMKVALLSLQDSLKSSFASLKVLMAVEDESIDYNGQLYLRSKETARVEFEEQMAALLTKVERLQTRYSGCEIQPATDLELPLTPEVRKFQPDLFTLLHPLLFLAVWVTLSYMYYWDPTNTWVVFYRMIRSSMFIILFLYLLGINMTIWGRFRINYPTVFGFPEKGIPTRKYIFDVAGFLVILTSIIVISFLCTSPFTQSAPAKILALLIWISFLIFLINPLDTCLRTGRLSLGLTFTHFLLAPFFPVTFADAWLAVQIKSLGVILLDLQYVFCYTFSSPWTGPVNQTLCITSANGLRPVIASLPALIQLLQYLRSYFDSRQRKHLINALKHCTTFPIIVFATLFSVSVPFTLSLSDVSFRETGWIIILWLLSSFVHAVYTFLWDVYYDWGLLQCSKKTLLRPELLYHYKSVYYLAIVVDLILQSTWTLEVTLAIVWRLQSDLVYTVLVVGECVRLFIWNIFRLESEQARCLVS